MSLNRYAAKKDDNHARIARAVANAGWLVTTTSASGLPDLLCMRAGVIVFLEVKSSRKGRMTERQVDCHEAFERFGVRVGVVCSPEGAVQAAYSLSAGGVTGVATYRDFPWEGHTAEQKAQRLARGLKGR